MSNRPHITLLIKGLKSELLDELIKESPKGMMLDFNAVHPVPSDNELQEIYFSNQMENKPEDIDTKKIQSLWKKDNWGIDLDIIPLDEYTRKNDFIIFYFRVNHSAPVAFISYLTEIYKEAFVYLGYNDMYDPTKYSFIGHNGNVWPLKSGPMLSDHNGNAIFTDKHGDYRYTKTNELVNEAEINYYGGRSFLNEMLFHLIK